MVIGMVGCASTSTEPQVPPALSAEFRAGLTTIGVVSSNSTPEPKIAVIPKGSGEGAVAGLKSGALTGASPGVSIMAATYGETTILPVAGIIAAAGALVGAATGIVYGAISAESVEKVEEAEEIINKAIAKLEVQKNLRYQVLETAQLETPYGFIDVSDYEYTESDRKRRYPILKDKEIGAILETNVLSFGLIKLAYTPPPKVAMFIETNVRIIEPQNGNVLYDKPFTYRSEFFDYFYWSGGDGKRLVEGLGDGYRSLAEKIVYEIFLRP